MKKHLTKSNDRVLAGVFGGIAEYFGWDVALTRVIGSILILWSVGTGLIAYAIAALVMPEPDGTHFSATDRFNSQADTHHEDTFDGEFTDPDRPHHDDK